MTALRSLWRALAAMHPSPWRVLLAAMLGSGALAASIALMGTSGWLISRAAQQPPVLYLMVAVVSVRAFGIGRGVLRYAERLVSHDLALRGVTQLRTTLYLRLAAADAPAVARLRRGDLLARIGADADALSDVVVRSLLPFATASLTCVASVIAMALVLPQAGVILGGGLLIALAGAPALAALAARRSIRDTSDVRSQMSTQVLALLEGLPELTVAGALPDRIAAVESSDLRLNGALGRAARPAAWGSALSTGAMGAAMLGCLAAGTAAVSHGRLAPVMLTVLVLVPLATVEVVAGLPEAAAGIVRALAAAERVAELLVLPAAPATLAADPPAATMRPGSAGQLTAHDLTCGWPGSKAVLTGVNLELAAGQRIAIVGPSGGGKTTLLLTLAGLIPAISGQVMLDGIELSSFDPAIVRSTIAFTADDAHVFTTTVRENVRAGCPAADERAILQAVHRAGLRDWVISLPAGLETIVGDPSGPGKDPGAHVLSGGERRRLLVARALVSRAGVLLVDEPAEHLDPAAADALLHGLFTAGPAVVVVTHRVTPLALADEILVVSGGRIEARGTHDWLITHHARYRSAWAAENPGVRGTYRADATLVL